MTDAHTPGPYEADALPFHKEAWAELNDGSALTMVRRGPDVLAVVWCPDDDRETQGAQARLFAAAPDLLEACRLAVGPLGSTGPAPAYEAVLAAIAKATATEQGESGMSDLITHLEEAAEGSRELDMAIWDATGGWSVNNPPAYTTSLDAALALAERVGLDGWNTLYAAMMNWKAHDPRGPLSKTLPLALCLAILKANHKDKP